MQTPTQKFLEALENWQEANREYHKCIAACDRSPGYFCEPARQRQGDAAYQMQLAFEEAVERGVRKALANITQEAK